MMKVRAALVAVPLAASVLLGAAPAQASATPTALTCLGQGIDLSAQLHYETSTFIKAPLSRVWRLHTEVSSWPSWQRAVSSMRPLTTGPLRAGSRFRWTTPAPATASTPATTLVITSTVAQVEHERCTRWTGPAIGQQIESDPTTAIKYLAPGLDAWLADLKAAAER
ncbi:MAG TPA: SRPBCC family protein [Pseudonocardiaceae bacterium]|jgi:uncharacterized membrane protein|nr:SRPBCC family protein [Pseudonocardiaceae bacterium]